MEKEFQELIESMKQKYIESKNEELSDANIEEYNAQMLSVFEEEVFNKLDVFITNYINDESNKEDIQSLDYMEKLSKKVLEMESPIITSEIYSREIDLNETIKIVYNFLKSINLQMAEQFMNLIREVDENNKPRVNFLCKEKKNQSSFVYEGREVYFSYSNTPADIFTLLHELLHVMNVSIINDEKDLTSTYKYFAETVSILSEELIGNYCIQNGYITENDFNIWKKNRLEWTKDNARSLILEAELIKMKLKGIKISQENFLHLLNIYDKESITYQVLNDEYNIFNHAHSLAEAEINILFLEKYVMGLVLTKEIIKGDDAVEKFIQFNHEVGNANSNLDNIMEEFVKKIC